MPQGRLFYVGPCQEYYVENITVDQRKSLKEKGSLAYCAILISNELTLLHLLGAVYRCKQFIKSPLLTDTIGLNGVSF